MVHISWTASKKTIRKSDFKPRAFELFRLVEVQHETIVITDRGRPVVKLVPIEDSDDPALAILRGTLRKYVDPLAPVGEEDWEAVR
jgi:prevent-host-death family protein